MPTRDKAHRFAEEYTLKAPLPTDLVGEIPLSQVAFFDTETTGLSGASHQVTVGGLAWADGRRIHLEQYFVPDPTKEGEVLAEFLARLGDFTCLCHYNGSSFDIPFLKERARRWRLKTPFREVVSVDWLTRARQLKRQLGFPDCTLMTVQAYLGLQRRDHIDGGEVVAMYYDWLDSGDVDVRSQILLHNADDIVLLMCAAAEMERRAVG
jgi:uncharacterized protein YprB with RNaseH-like and TPR domain